MYPLPTKVIFTHNHFILGICRSYEHQCTSGVCIMEELVCNGHNPCGDRSDCPTSPTEVAAEESHVITAAIITACLLCAGVFIGLILFWRCYRRRVKLRVSSFLDETLYASV